MIWYHYLKPQSGKGGGLLKDKKPGTIIIAKEENQSRLYTQIDRLTLEGIIKSNARQFHEVILGEQGQKFKIDIDGDDVGNPIKIRNSIILAIFSVFEDLRIQLTTNDLLVFQSIPSKNWYGKEEKTDSFSYHIVVNNYYCPTAGIAKNIAKKVAEKTKYGKYIDLNVYKSIQLFRLVGCHKENRTDIKKLLTVWKYNNETICRKITKTTFNSTLITAISNCSPITVPDYVPNSIISNDSNVDAETAIEAIYSFVGSDCYKYRSVEDGRVYFDRLYPSYCSVCERDHDRNGAMIYSYNKKLYFRCWSAEKAIKMGDNVVEKKVDENLHELKKQYSMKNVLYL